MVSTRLPIFLIAGADVAELADALGSGPSGQLNARPGSTPGVGTTFRLSVARVVS